MASENDVNSRKIQAQIYEFKIGDFYLDSLHKPLSQIHDSDDSSLANRKLNEKLRRGDFQSDSFGKSKSSWEMLQRHQKQERPDFRESSMFEIVVYSRSTCSMTWTALTTEKDKININVFLNAHSLPFSITLHVE